jgi:hypothetical protein
MLALTILLLAGACGTPAGYSPPPPSEFSELGDDGGKEGGGGY